MTAQPDGRRPEENDRDYAITFTVDTADSTADSTADTQTPNATVQALGPHVPPPLKADYVIPLLFAQFGTLSMGYFHFNRTAPISHTVAVTDDVNVDVSDDGQIVGIEVLSDSAMIPARLFMNRLRAE